MTNIDKATGLPELPPDYYWKVQVVWNDYSPVPGAWLILRKRKSWVALASEYVEFGSLDPRDKAAGRPRNNRHHDLLKIDPADYAAAIASVADAVLEKHAESLAAEAFRAKFKSAKNALSGKYPPKKLEV